MGKTYVAVLKTITIQGLLDVSKREDQEMFPVLNDEKRRQLICLVTVDDLKDYSDKEQPIAEVLSDIIAKKPERLLHVHGYTHRDKALDLINAYGLKFIPAVNDTMGFIGTLDQEDARHSCCLHG